MKDCVIPNSLVNVILILLYVESYCCVKIDRESRDISDTLNQSNCDGISSAYFIGGGRCTCVTFSSILSTNTGRIACIRNRNIDKSKHT